jgi:hypothetical protein
MLVDSIWFLDILTLGAQLQANSRGIAAEHMLWGVKFQWQY